MIIDAHVHLSGRMSPSLRQAAFGADELLAQMEGPFIVDGQPCRVERAVAQPHPSDIVLGGDIVEQHAVVVDAATEHPDRIWGCMIFDPHAGAPAGIRALRELMGSGFRGVKLHPTMHAWYLDDAEPELAPLMRFCADHGVPVIIHTGDPPHAQPVQAVPLVSAHPGTTFILAHLGTQQINYSHQAIQVARHHPNVCLEAGWGILPRIKDAVGAIGAERILHASDCPIQEMGSQIRLLEVLSWDPPVGANVSPADVELILGGNADRLFGAAS